MPFIRSRFLCPLASILLVLAGCTSHPEGVLRPIAADAQGGDSVDMLVATTRAAAPGPDLDFTGERGDEMSLANIVVSIPPGRQVGQIQWPSAVPGDPRRDFVTTRATMLPRQDVPRWFDRAGGKARRVFVFVHGFNTRFDSAVFRFAQLAHDIDAGAAPVLFTWPSRGQVLGYNYDRESANFSRSDLASVLNAATASAKVSEVTILAHSMGAWIAMEALRQIALQRGGVSPKIDTVILASPDLDVDVFRRQLQEIGPRRPDITVFTSGNDRALGVSSLIAGRVTRLGAVDVSTADDRAKFADMRGLTFIDLSRLRSGDAFNHNTFATSPEAVRLIGDRLVSGQPITDADMVTPLGAVQTLGTAAGTLVATPFLILQGAQPQ